MKTHSSLVADFPEEQRYHVELALTASNLGLLLQRAGRRAEAEAVLHDAVTRLHRCVETEGSAVRPQRALAAALGNLGSLRSNPTAAIEDLRQAVAVQQRLETLLPNRMRASDEIATTYNNLGAAYLRAKDYPAAIEAFAEAITRQRRLRDLAPWVTKNTRNLATSLNNLAKAQRLAEQFRAAEATVIEAIRLEASHLASDPRDALTQSRLGVMHGNHALVLQESGGHWRETANAFATAIRYQQQAAEARPESADYRNYLAQHYAGVLDLQIDHERWSDALDTARAYAESQQGHPRRLLGVAQNLALISKRIPTGNLRDRAVSLLAETLDGVRTAGLEIDASLFDLPEFKHLAGSKTLTRVVTP